MADLAANTDFVWAVKLSRLSHLQYHIAFVHAEAVIYLIKTNFHPNS